MEPKPKTVKTKNYFNYSLTRITMKIDIYRADPATNG